MFNSCDGCRAGMPIEWRKGVLRDNSVPMHINQAGHVHMICCADMYEDQNVVRTTDSGEHGPAVLSEN